ncbi:dihydrolipoyl dehydrogenase [candidate division WWE3 bacterium]|uniref:Dihydrolipoyl dehydrogenase n=1 Tax=candidate division WWE3 bacterium TaxID=2053526 RepID=A0A955LH24_UNCKA|nr:dihydrolipoyl dehydrogenase [candidate division WWE3 bacterium]
MESKHYDLIVIGAGSGLNVASAAANQLNWKVAVIEDGPLGGTCLNRGCIPSKMIIHAADIAETINRSELFGIQSEITHIDFEFITKRANDIVDADAENIKEGVNEHQNMDLYQAKGTFVSSKTVKVDGVEITGDRILIAAGARPFVPPIPGIDSVDYWTSTEALRQTKQPKSLAIIGGGYIGMELGHFYGALGTEITIIEALDSLIFREDKDVSTMFTKLIGEKYSLHLKSNVTNISQDDSGMKTITFETEDGSSKTIETEALLVVTGTKPNTDSLNLGVTEISTSERGFIEVNEYMETSVENIFALGDIVGKAPFKHGANYEAQIIFKNFLNNGSKIAADYSVMPHAIFTAPQIAGVGITEQEAQEKKLEYEIRTHQYIKTGMGKAIEAGDGFVKFIIDPKNEIILGCHILGPEASTLIHEVVIALSAGQGKISAIKNSIHVHPALSEVVQRAL